MNMQETFQAAFDRAVAGLAGQGFERSMNADGLRCRYSGDGGRHCAYYYVKPHETFVEGESASEQPHNAGEFMDLLRFYNKLQIAHDWGSTPQEMKRRLRDLAKTYALTIPEVLK